MHIKFETKALDTALSGIAKIITSPKFIQLEGKDGKVKVMTTHEGFSVSCELPCELKSPGKFAVVYDDLKKLFRNRKEIEMKLADKGNKVMFKAGSSKDFSGDIVTLETHRIEFKGAEDYVKLDDKQSEFLFGVVSCLALDDVYFKKPLPLTVHFSDTSGYCLVNSDFHIAVAKTKGTFAPLSITLPYKNFTAIMNLAGNKAFNMSVTDSCIVVKADSFDVVMPVESQEENNTKAFLKIVANVLQEEPIAAVEMLNLKSSMDCIMAIHDGKAGMDCKISKAVGGIALSISSLRGSVQDVLKTKVKGESEFKVSPVMVSNIIRNAKKGVFKLRVSDRMFAFSNSSENVDFHYIGTFIAE